jgi:hypothetical protein
MPLPRQVRSGHPGFCSPGRLASSTFCDSMPLSPCAGFVESGKSRHSPAFASSVELIALWRPRPRSSRTERLQGFLRLPVCDFFSCCWRS